MTRDKHETTRLRSTRLSPEGRARCAEAGAKNLANWRAKQPKVDEKARRLDEFRAELVAAKANRVAIDAMVASYAVVLRFSSSASLTRLSYKALPELSRASGRLLRALKALGLLGEVIADERREPDATALERYLASRTKPETGATAALEGDPDGQD
jgi:hypothetical protein